MPQSLLDSTISHFQGIFPSVNLPPPTRPLDQYLTVMTSALPVPPEPNLQATLATMRHLMDAQEYKHQRNLLANPQDQELETEEEASRVMADCYEQGSTHMGRKETTFTNDGSEMLDLWSWADDRGVPAPPNREEEYLLFID